jgi:hypothetical protein
LGEQLVAERGTARLTAAVGTLADPAKRSLDGREPPLHLVEAKMGESRRRAFLCAVHLEGQ